MNFHKLVLIGLLFQFLDFNISSIDLIPDFVGFIIVAYAFSKVKVPYAALGMYCSVLLSISSFMEMFQGKTQTTSFYGAVDLWLQILFIVIGLIEILQLACIFYVSNKAVKIESSIFPTLFISAQILMQLVFAFGIHAPFDNAGIFLIPIVFIFFFFYMYFVIFLWKRKNIEKKMYKEMQVELDSLNNSIR